MHGGVEDNLLRGNSMEPAAGKIVPQIAPTLLGEEDLQRVYNWVDEIQLSRPKKNISRDFADGVLFAEIINGYFPRLIEMHNFSAASNLNTKMYNWNTLNSKVLKKLGYQIHQQDIDEICRASPGAVERVLRTLQEKVTSAQRNGLPRTSGAAVGGDSVLARMEKRADERAVARETNTSKPKVVEEGGFDTPPASQAAKGGQPQQQQMRQVPQKQRKQMEQEVDVELLAEKEQKISELTEMVDIMSEKIRKLEQLVRIKDSKIDALGKKMEKHGVS